MDRVSSMAVFLKTEKSKFTIPGPLTCPIPLLPKTNGAGSAKQPVSNQSLDQLGAAHLRAHDVGAVAGPRIQA